MTDPKQQILDLAIVAFADHRRKTWRLGGRIPKVYLKSQIERAMDEARLITFVEILSRVDLGFPVGVEFDLPELAVKVGLIDEEWRHKDDPENMDGLRAKGRSIGGWKASHR